jgi:antitoxin VapB
MTQTAKLVMNDGVQAVQLPADFRFDATEVFIWRDRVTGDVVLSRRPPNWDDFFAALAEAEVPADFLDERERHQQPQDRDPFAEWSSN